MIGKVIFKRFQREGPPVPTVAVSGGGRTGENKMNGLTEDSAQ